MKKFISVLLALCMASSFAACSDNAASGKEDDEKTLNKEEAVKESVLELGVKNTVADYAEFTLFKVHATKKITASMDDAIYYGNDNEGETYVDVIIDFTNISADTVNTDDIFTLTAINAAGVKFDDFLCAAETDNSTFVSTYENINPLASARLHCAVSVPETETALMLKLAINGEVYSLDYSLGEVVSNAKPMNEGDTVEAENFASVTFVGYEFTDSLLPSDTSRSYSSYQVDSVSNTYLVLKFDVTNLSSDGRRCDSFLGATAVFMDKYSYNGFTVVEDEDMRGFNSYEKLIPLVERHLFCIIEIPKTVADKDMTVTVAFAGDEYTITKAADGETGAAE